MAKAKEFMSFVDDSNPDGCWLWSGPQGTHGYGIYYNVRVVRAHRWSYELFVGEIPDGLVIDHLCERKLCVNPSHLEAVTQGVNVSRYAERRWGRVDAPIEREGNRMVKKETPPPTKQTKKNIDWDKAVEEMKKAKGEWHNLGDFSPGIAAHMRSGKYKAFVPPGTADKAAYMTKHWEITSRVITTGFPRVDIYCRWLG